MTNSEIKKVLLETPKGKGTLFSVHEEIETQEVPSAKQELFCGDSIINSGKWQSETRRQDADEISCFVRSLNTASVHAIMIAKQSHSLEDRLKRDGQIVGKIIKIVRPVRSAPMARIVEETVQKNQICASAVEINQNAWIPKQRYRANDSNACWQAREPQINESVFLQTKSGQITGVISQLDATDRLDDWWFVDVFSVRLTESISGSELTGGLVLSTTGVLGLVIRHKSGKFLICSKISKVLEKFESVLL